MQFIVIIFSPPYPKFLEGMGYGEGDTFYKKYPLPHIIFL